MKAMFRKLLIALAIISSFTEGSFAASNLAANFVSPPPSARPWVYWFWLNGNVTREGITADLEAMARVGIGGVVIFEVTQNVPKGPVTYGSKTWHEMVDFALAEAKRLGLQVDMNNDAGWSGSGGPWIPPELAMQQVTFSTTNAVGAQHFEQVLPQPNTVQGFYRDIAVLAFPPPQGETAKMSDAQPKASVSPTDPKLIKAAANFIPDEMKDTNHGDEHNPQNLVDGNPDTIVTLLRPEPSHPQWVEVEFPKPYALRTVTVNLLGNPRTGGLHGKFQISSDGHDFKTVREFDGEPPAIVFNVPEVTARWFRIEFTQARHGRLSKIQITDVDLSPSYRIEGIAGKAVFIPAQFTATENVLPRAQWPTVDPSLAIAQSQILNLTSKMDKNGHLVWDMPPGNWTILRAGYTLTGRQNEPAPKGGIGLECDKLSKEAIRTMFAGLIGPIADKNRALVGGGTGLISTHIDSWEAGSQNWTPKMPEEFLRLRGYDLLKYLPVLSGRVVDSEDVSERFLWDFRRTVSDLVQENYAAELRRLANEKGLRLSIEAYNGCPTDEIAYGGQADEPWAEFWADFWFGEKIHNAFSLVSMASSAHIYGKAVAGSEAFTANDEEKWQRYPGNLKSEGDWAFSQGINRFSFHRYAMQPWPDRRPGMSMGPWGVHYERTQTWWEQSTAWHEYLARCQYLLQQGLFVADILCVEPEGTSRFVAPASIQPVDSLERPGYNYDGCPADALISRVTVKDGRLVLPDGMSYRVLLLPAIATMTPQLLQKVKELVAAGATVVGPTVPTQSPSLTDYPHCDKVVQQLASELWGSGQIISDKTPAQVLAERGVPPDFSSRNNKGEETLRFTHRKIGDTDLYFVANKNSESEEALCSFRVKGRQPELWWPDTGKIERPAIYDATGEVVRMPIRFDPYGSVFVVFRSDLPAEPDRILSVTRDSRTLLDTHDALKGGAVDVVRNDRGGLEVQTSASGSYGLKTADGHSLKIKVPALPPTEELAGSWEVSFDPQWGGPADPVKFRSLVDWSQRPEAGIRYYSGSAIYRKTFAFPDLEQLKREGARVFLDLGKVSVMASVKLNGIDLGVLWKTPFRLDITDALKPGPNDLELKVTNLWVNRQIGDEQLPEDSARDPRGYLKSWPQWLEEGKPSPTGRYTFGSWRLWKKDDPLIKSGLLGPVTLQVLAHASPSK